MIRHLIIFAMVFLGTMLIDNDTWATAIGGCLLFVAGGMFGENEAKKENKLYDHLRKETKR